jgi:peptidoglycan/LPS O-acetylase OafA/YrhL
MFAGINSGNSLPGTPGADSSSGTGTVVRAARALESNGRTKVERPPRANYPHLDFVRSFAVTLVFAGHLAHSLGHDNHVGTAAHFGVVIFFVHTCLVLFLSMERLGPKRLFGRFYVRRIARIYPLAIAAVLLVLLAHIPAATWVPYFAPDWRTIAANILLIQNITGHDSVLVSMWSLPFEVQMYAVLPFLFVLHARHRASALAIWTCAALFSGALWLLPSDEPAKICVYIPCFCSGIVAYSMLRRPRQLSFGTLVTAMAGLLVAAMTLGHLRVPFAILDGCAALAVGLVIGRYSVVPAFMAGASAAIAKYSYGIYLAHLPIMWFCFSDGQRRWTLFAFLSVFVPVVLYHAIEQPFIRLGARAFALPPLASDDKLMASATA